VDTQNSQKKSPRSSAKIEMESAETRRPQSQRKSGSDAGDEEKYMDHSFDHVARVRAAREAAQREMESFGEVSEYDITIIQGQLKETPVTPSQTALDFESKDLVERKEED
jgi:hypothetical protein